MASIEPIRAEDQDVLVFVRVKPRASRSRILGERDGELEISVCAPPVDGAANLELVRLLSKTLGVSKSRVKIERGDTSRHKVVRLEGVALGVARGLLSG